MANPQINGKTQTRERPTYSELVWTQLQETRTELRDTRKELNARMDRIELRMDRVEAKLDKLADKVDALHNEIKSSTGHISIANISTVGIALAAIYAIIFK